MHPATLDLLHSLRLPTDALLRSKSWDEFARPGAPTMDFVLTVCDQAAGEVCPIWPGAPMTAHWGVPDPVTAESTAVERQAFRDALHLLETRITLLIALPIEKLDPPAMRPTWMTSGGPQPMRSLLRRRAHLVSAIIEIAEAVEASGDGALDLWRSNCSCAATCF